MGLVDHQVVAVHPRALVSTPLVLLPGAAKHAKRGPSRVRSRATSCVAIEFGREEDAFGIRIEEYFLPVEAKPLGRSRRTVDRVGVVGAVAHSRSRQDAVPDPAGLVRDRIEIVREERFDDGVAPVEVETNRSCVFGVDREVDCVEPLNIGVTTETRIALFRDPILHQWWSSCRTLRAYPSNMARRARLFCRERTARIEGLLRFGACVQSTNGPGHRVFRARRWTRRQHSPCGAEHRVRRPAPIEVTWIQAPSRGFAAAPTRSSICTARYGGR